MDSCLCVSVLPWPCLANKARLARAGNKNTHSDSLSLSLSLSLSISRAGTAGCLQGQTGGSAASLAPLHLSPLPSLSPSVWACHLSALILPSLSLLHLNVSVVQVPSSHITFPPFPSLPLPLILSWRVNSWPLGLTLCSYPPALPSNTSCQSGLSTAVRREMAKAVRIKQKLAPTISIYLNPKLTKKHRFLFLASSWCTSAPPRGKQSLRDNISFVPVKEFKRDTSWIQGYY